MPKKLTRAERYKRNYRIIKNTYQDTTLAKSAQTWSDKRIYEDLGIKVAKKKTPEFKYIKKTQKAYYTRKLNKYLYARSIGLGVKESKRARPYKKSKIDVSYEYQDVSSKKRNIKNKNRRIALWKKWSLRNIDKDGKFTREKGNMPPEIEKIARDRNRQTEVAKKQLDDYAAYGYIVAFYQFVEGKTFEEIKDIVNPDPHDSLRVRYKTEVRAV